MLAALLNLLTKFLPGHLPRLAIERPDLLVDHGIAYVALAKQQLESIKRQLFRRVLAGTVASIATLAFLVLAGVALMLHAITSALALPLPLPLANATWTLLAVPGAMLVVALIATTIALTKTSERAGAQSLSAQWALDIQALRKATEARP
jgi:uncharacterized membrane protein